MAGHWTFGQRIAAGFALTVALAVVIGGIAVYALRTVVAIKDRVIDVNAQLLVSAKEIQFLLEEKASEARGFLLTRDERLLTGMRDARSRFTQAMDGLRQNVPTDEGRRLLDSIVRFEDDHQRALDQVIALRRTDAS